jgi:hypothetical protein
MRNVCINLVRKSKGKTPPVRPKSTWKDNIEMGLKKIGCEDADTIMNIRVL